MDWAGRSPKPRTSSSVLPEGGGCVLENVNSGLPFPTGLMVGLKLFAPCGLVFSRTMRRELFIGGKVVAEIFFWAPDIPPGTVN